MAKRIYIKPAQGLRVVYPETNVVLPEEGARVVPNQYWNRRLRDGDVIRVKGGSRKPGAGQTQRPKQGADKSEG